MALIFHLLESISFGISIYKFISQCASMVLRKGVIQHQFPILGDYLSGRYKAQNCYPPKENVIICFRVICTFFSASEEVCEALLVIVTTLVKLAGSRTLTPFKGTTTAFFLALICTGRNILQKPYTPLLKILSFKPLAIKWTSLILIKCTFVMWSYCNLVFPWLRNWQRLRVKM